MFTGTVEWNILQIERSHVIVPSFRYVDALTQRFVTQTHEN